MRTEFGADQGLSAALHQGRVRVQGIEQQPRELRCLDLFDETRILLRMFAEHLAGTFGGLLVMVMVSGYENFVSTLDVAEGQEKLSWLGTMDASSLKLKIAVSIVAISSIHLLRIFMNAEKTANDKLMWFTLIHLTFVASAFAMGYLDKLTKK